MPHRKIVNLATYRNRESEELVRYLARRCEVDDMRGMFVVSIDRKGRLKAHATGKCKEELDSIIGKVLALTMKTTAAGGSFDEPTRL